MSDYTKQREFIHDISNQLAIVEGSIKRARSLRNKDQTDDTLVEIEKSFDLSEEYMKKCILKLKEFRSHIHTLERS